MASARRLPTTPNTSTYDSAGGKDFAALTTWEQATDIDLVTANAGEILEVFKGAHDDNVSMAGATTNSIYFRVIKPASGEGHLDISSGIPAVDGTMAAFVSTTDSPMLPIDESFSQIHDIVGKLVINSANNRLTFGSRQPSAGTIGCLAIDSANSGAGNVVRDFSLGTTANFAIDCLSINAQVNGLTGGVNLGLTAYIYNFTCINAGAIGIEVTGAGTVAAKNCLIDNSTGNDYDAGAGILTLTTCGSSDATGTVALRNQTYSFRSAIGDDYHLAVGSDGIGDGTDLSADGNYAFDDDIDETIRSSWDLGFDEFESLANMLLLNKPNLQANINQLRGNMQ